MKLFRRILMSLFPPEVGSSTVNPASMFVSFISPKRFFSVINRKIVENYKLNLFDIGLDPFEVKIGFGDQPTINVKDIDFYYGYNVVANLNGWSFYAPSNLGTAICLVMSVRTRSVFKQVDHGYYISFLMTVYLLTFVFAARIKVFPHTDQEKNYRRFIDLFFEFYRLAIEQYGVTADEKLIEELRSSLLQKIDLFFLLFYFYQRMNSLFYAAHISEKEFYHWLFYEEIKRGKHQELVGEFVSHATAYTRIKSFSDQDKELMKLIFPADVLVRYLFQGADSRLIADKLLAQIYDQEKLDGYIRSFLTDDSQLDEFMSYILDWRIYKENYFEGMKAITTHKFRVKNDYETSKEIDSFMSSLGDAESLEGIKVPDKLKQESVMMERLLNFYITFLGGLRVARGDNFSLRLQKKELIEQLIGEHQIDTTKQDALFFYGGLLYNYSKNIFYYKYAFENVKAGNEKFQLPFRASFKEVYSNMFILKLFNESFINTILQDINQKNLKIYITNQQMLKTFKNVLGQELSHLMKADDETIIDQVYRRVEVFLPAISHFVSTLHDYLDGDDVEQIKENLYTLDLWMWLEALQYLGEEEVDFASNYGDLSILGVIAGMRDTLFGLLLYLTHLQKEASEAQIDLKLQALKKIYILDVLNLSESYLDVFDRMIEKLLIRYHPILNLWISLDDNKKYFGIGLGNWLGFVEDKNDEKITHEMMGEDIIRFRGYIKTISYYNKRYLIPK